MKKTFVVFMLAGFLASFAPAQMVYTDIAEAKADVGIAGLNSATAGGVWRNMDGFPGSPDNWHDFRADAAGENFAFYWRKTSGDTAWNNRLCLDFSETLDYEKDAVVVKFSMGQGHPGADKNLRVSALDPHGERIFTMDWKMTFGEMDVLLQIGQPSGFFVPENEDTRVASNYAKSLWTSTTYEPESMGAFEFILDGDELTLELGDGSSKTLTGLAELGSSQIRSLVFHQRSNQAWAQAMWLDGIEVRVGGEQSTSILIIGALGGRFGLGQGMIPTVDSIASRK